MGKAGGKGHGRPHLFAVIDNGLELFSQCRQ